MKVVSDILLLFSKFFVFLLLSNFMMKFELFFNYYTIVLYGFAVLIMGISSFGLKGSVALLAKSALPSQSFDVNPLISQGFYRFSYISGVLVALSGLIIILSDLERMITSENNYFEAIAINLLPLLYGMYFAELFFKPLENKIENEK